MCGIVGIASTTSVDRRDWLQAGRDALCHRGPDDAGQWWSDDGRVGLGHRRLAIVDLSAAGQQPMHNYARDLTIVFNGEIYNFLDLKRDLASAGHVFRSSSDTEVILAAYREWGEDCLRHLNGMFAFALFDARRMVVLIARDRAGEKPLFLYQTREQLRFASELKALLSDQTLERKIDRAALDHYLAFGYVPSDRCILTGFAKLRPAHAMTFCLRTGRTRTWPYWSLPEPPLALDVVEDEKLRDADDMKLVDDFENLLADSVQRQLVADVPVGILLSGGVDSSLVTAMATRAVNRVKTFTISFPGHGQMDESKHAGLIAKHFGTDHTELQALPITADLMQDLARQFDEPMVDSSMFPTFLVTRLARQHCTVALGGDGGDELFGGYPNHTTLQRMQHRADHFPLATRRLVAAAAERFLPIGFRGRHWLQVFGTDFDRTVSLVAPLFDPPARKRLMSRRGKWNAEAESELCRATPSNLDMVQRMTRLDFVRYLSEDILVKVDRTSMLNSLEVRAPFLDHRIVEFAYGKVPSRMKATASGRKILLRKLARKILPPSFDSERKQGFSIPLTSWLKSGPFRDLFWSVLTDSRCAFDLQTVGQLLDGQDKGFSNSERLFSLVQFELWRKIYNVQL